MHSVQGFYQSSAQFKVGTITRCFDNPNPMLPFVLDPQSQIRKTVENVVYRKGTQFPHGNSLQQTPTFNSSHSTPTSSSYSSSSPLSLPLNQPSLPPPRETQRVTAPVPVSLVDSPIFAKPYNHIIQRDPALKRRFQELAPAQSLAETLVRDWNVVVTIL